MPKVNIPRFARGGRAASKATASGAGVGQSSGRMAAMKNTRVAKTVMKHPVASGAVGLTALGLAKGRRGRGVDKTRGRPTGMYQY